MRVARAKNSRYPSVKRTTAARRSHPVGCKPDAQHAHPTYPGIQSPGQKTGKRAQGEASQASRECARVLSAMASRNLDGKIDVKVASPVIYPHRIHCGNPVNIDLKQAMCQAGHGRIAVFQARVQDSCPSTQNHPDGTDSLMPVSPCIHLKVAGGPGRCAGALVIRAERAKGSKTDGNGQTVCCVNASGTSTYVSNAAGVKERSSEEAVRGIMNSPGCPACFR